MDEMQIELMRALEAIRNAEDVAAECLMPTKVMMQLSAAKQALLAARMGCEGLMGFANGE